MNNIYTLQRLETENEDKRKLLKNKIEQNTKQFIDIINPNLEDSKEIINKAIEDKNDNNHVSVMNIRNARNNFLDYCEGVIKDENILNMVKLLINNNALQSCDSSIKDTVIVNLVNKLDLTEEQKEYITNEYLRITKQTKDDLNKALNIPFDITKYKNRPKDMKNVLHKFYYQI